MDNLINIVFTNSFITLLYERTAFIHELLGDDRPWTLLGEGAGRSIPDTLPERCCVNSYYDTLSAQDYARLVGGNFLNPCMTGFIADSDHWEWQLRQLPVARTAFRFLPVSYTRFMHHLHALPPLGPSWDFLYDLSSDDYDGQERAMSQLVSRLNVISATNEFIIH